MTGKADFTEEEWKTVVSGPTSAGFMVLTASKGGMFKETFAMSKVWAEARGQHGQSQLLDELAASKPKMDRDGASSPEEIREAGLQQIREALTLLEAKATPDEIEDYRNFVRTVADRVANAHEEGGAQVSDAERQTIDEISAALGGGTAA